MTQEKETLVLRTSKELKSRIDKISKKRNSTMTSVINEALELYLQNSEYTFEDVLEIIDKIPSLSLNKEKIKFEMEGCPSGMCKQFIDSIKDKQVFLFEEENFDSLIKRIEDIEKNNLYGVFIHITSKAREDINKVNESMIKIAEILKDTKLNLGAGLKSNHHDKILLFVSYNKKDGADENKS